MHLQFRCDDLAIFQKMFFGGEALGYSLLRVLQRLCVVQTEGPADRGRVWEYLHAVKCVQRPCPPGLRRLPCNQMSDKVRPECDDQVINLYGRGESLYQELRNSFSNQKTPVSATKFRGFRNQKKLISRTKKNWFRLPKINK